jgi:hypothetical protein
MNSLTYKTDDSFFTFLVVPGDFHRDAVLKWFETSPQAKFRFIRDNEIETDYLSLQQIDDIYPGIKTVSVVTNPWLRIVRAYNTIHLLKTAKRTIPANVFDFNIDSFEDFVCNLKNIPTTSKYWFTPTTPQKQWLEYSTEEGTRTVDYILKSETIDADFKIIQDYFCTDVPLINKDKIPAYRKFYTKKTRDIVADIFAEDIEYFNYKF